MDNSGRNQDLKAQAPRSLSKQDSGKPKIISENGLDKFLSTRDPTRIQNIDHELARPLESSVIPRAGNDKLTCGHCVLRVSLKGQ